MDKTQYLCVDTASKGPVLHDASTSAILEWLPLILRFRRQMVGQQLPLRQFISSEVQRRISRQAIRSDEVTYNLYDDEILSQTPGLLGLQTDDLKGYADTYKLLDDSGQLKLDASGLPAVMLHPAVVALDDKKVQEQLFRHATRLIEHDDEIAVFFSEHLKPLPDASMPSVEQFASQTAQLIRMLAHCDFVKENEVKVDSSRLIVDTVRNLICARPHQGFPALKVKMDQLCRYASAVKCGDGDVTAHVKKDLPLFLGTMLQEAKSIEKAKREFSHITKMESSLSTPRSAAAGTSVDTGKVSKASKGKGSKEMWCSRHRSKTHNTKECRVWLQEQALSGAASSSNVKTGSAPVSGTTNRTPNSDLRCTHCNKMGHTVVRCFQLHPELKSKSATNAPAISTSASASSGKPTSGQPRPAHAYNTRSTTKHPPSNRGHVGTVLVQSDNVDIKHGVAALEVQASDSSPNEDHRTFVQPLLRMQASRLVLDAIVNDQPVVALWDTGASISCVRSSVLPDDMPSTRTVTLSGFTPGINRVVPVVDVCLSFDVGSSRTTKYQVTCMTAVALISDLMPGVDAIVGSDVMTQLGLVKCAAEHTDDPDCDVSDDERVLDPDLQVCVPLSQLTVSEHSVIVPPTHNTTSIHAVSVTPTPSTTHSWSTKARAAKARRRAADHAGLQEEEQKRQDETVVAAYVPGPIGPASVKKHHRWLGQQGLAHSIGAVQAVTSDSPYKPCISGDDQEMVHELHVPIPPPGTQEVAWSHPTAHTRAALQPPPVVTMSASVCAALHEHDRIAPWVPLPTSSGNQTAEQPTPMRDRSAPARKAPRLSKRRRAAYEGPSDQAVGAHLRQLIGDLGETPVHNDFLPSRRTTSVPDDCFPLFDVCHAPAAGIRYVACVTEQEKEADPARSDFANGMSDNVSIQRLLDCDDLQILPAMMPVLEKWYTSFSMHGKEGPSTRSCDDIPIPAMPIELTDYSSLVIPARRVPLLLEQPLNAALDALCLHGFIRETTADDLGMFCSPVVVVPKRDAADLPRVTVDFRLLNQRMKIESHPMPTVDAAFASIAESKARLFVSLDLRHGFYQLPLAEEAKQYAGFRTHTRAFRFEGVPMGLRNSPQYFQRTMSTFVLNDLLTLCYCFVDDTIVWGVDPADLAANVDTVLERFHRFDLRLGLAKCDFSAKEIKYLGLIVDANGRRVNPDRVEAFLRMAPPSNTNETKTLLGMLSYYSAFIGSDFAEIVRPLRDAAKLFVWETAQVSAFKKVMERLAQRVLLTHVDMSLPFVIRTDASCVGFGGMLIQIRPGEGDAAATEETIAVFSSTADKAQRNWSTYEQELWAIILGLRKFHDFVYLKSNVIIETDHRNLQWMYQSQARKVIRWRLELQAYGFGIFHIPGRDNVVADAASRLVPSHTVCPVVAAIAALPHADLAPRSPMHVPVAAAVAAVVASEPQEFDMPTDRTWDSALKDVAACKRRMRAGDTALSDSDRRVRFCIVAHDMSGHWSHDCTLSLLKGCGITWTTMEADVQAYVQSCPRCQKAKFSGFRTHGLLRQMTAQGPLHILQADFIGPLLVCTKGFKYIFVLMDKFSRFTRLYACVDNGAATAAHCLIDFVTTFGFPVTWVSDNGPHFRNALHESMCELFGIGRVLNTPHHPQAHGAVERKIREVRRLIATMATSNRTWSDALPAVQLALNTTPLGVLGNFTASQVFIHSSSGQGVAGTVLRYPSTHVTRVAHLSVDLASTMAMWQKTVDAMREKVSEIMNKDHALAARRHDRRHHDLHLDIDDLVLVRYPYSAQSLQGRLRGPFRVVDTVDSQSQQVFVVKDLLTGKSQRVHSSRIRPYNDARANGDEDLRDVAASDGSEEYDVHKVVAHSYDEDGDLYLRIAWLGFGDDYSWERVTPELLMTGKIKAYVNRHCLRT